MTPRPPACPVAPRSFLHEAAFVFLGNTAIALFMVAANIEDFRADFIYAQCIGLSIFLAIRTLCVVRRRTKPGLLESALGIPLGGMAGFLLGTWSNGLSLAEVLESHPHAMNISAAGAVFFGGIAAYYFHTHTRLLEAEATAREERLRRVEQEGLAARAELRLLQARIEPHFLFNTLSNTVGLIDSNPAAARAMLIDLAALLRAALKNGGGEETTLREELDFIRAYLAIMARRMGERLSWNIDAEPALLETRLPPLLLQPLAENAIRYGLEPKVAGGRLDIVCRRAADQLEIAVRDDGLGLANNGTGGNGIGLANLRARLKARYGGKAMLALSANPGGGVSATLTIPLEQPSCVS